MVASVPALDIKTAHPQIARSLFGSVAHTIGNKATGCYLGLEELSEDLDRMNGMSAEELKDSFSPFRDKTKKAISKIWQYLDQAINKSKILFLLGRPADRAPTESGFQVAEALSNPISIQAKDQDELKEFLSERFQFYPRINFEQLGRDEFYTDYQVLVDFLNFLVKEEVSKYLNFNSPVNFSGHCAHGLDIDISLKNDQKVNYLMTELHDDEENLSKLLSLGGAVRPHADGKKITFRIPNLVPMSEQGIDTSSKLSIHCAHPSIVREPIFNLKHKARNLVNPLLNNLCPRLNVGETLTEDKVDLITKSIQGIASLVDTVLNPIGDFLMNSVYGVGKIYKGNEPAPVPVNLQAYNLGALVGSIESKIPNAETNIADDDCKFYTDAKLLDEVLDMLIKIPGFKLGEDNVRLESYGKTSDFSEVAGLTLCFNLEDPARFKHFVLEDGVYADFFSKLLSIGLSLSEAGQANEFVLTIPNLKPTTQES